MTKLPIREIVLYKHGVGFFVREGETDAQEISLSFRPTEINDVLKSLTVFDRAGGRITGIYYQTPIDKPTRLFESGLELSDFGSLRDLLRDLRGRNISITYVEGEKNKSISGRMIGVESQNKGDEKISILATDGQVRILPFDDVRSFRIIDEQASQNLNYFLDNSVTEENRRTVALRLTEGNHQLVVYYIAPSPTWRVSYRLVAESDPKANTGKALLQGWGIFDNRLDEDLENIRLTLIAGQPISFIYDLYDSHIPERPTVKDEAHKPVAPMDYAPEYERAITTTDNDAHFFGRSPNAPKAGGSLLRGKLLGAGAQAPASSISVNTETKDMNELFQYLVMTPVSVKRGESALVPILSNSLKYERELLYNHSKHPSNPVVALRFDNTTGLTLERGPVTVVEDGAYKGEAIIPFTKSNTTVYVPFAVELNIRVVLTTEVSLQLGGIKFEKGFLMEQQYSIYTQTYQIENRTEKAQTLVIEVANKLSDRTELVDTPQPDAKTLEELRWRVALPQKGVAVWQVKTRTLIAQRVEVRQLSYDNLQKYLEKRFLDATTYASLKEILDTIALIDSLKRKQTKSEEDKTALFRQNDEWRKSIDVLKVGTTDDAFRGRLLKQLEDSEDKLNLLNRDIKATEAKISACEKRIEQLIQALPSGS